MDVPHLTLTLVFLFYFCHRVRCATSKSKSSEVLLISIFWYVMRKYEGFFGKNRT